MNVSFIRYNIKRYFPGHDVDAVFHVLRGYPTSDGYRPDFMYLALLRLADGDVGELRAWVQRAVSDADSVSRAAGSVETWEEVVQFFDRPVFQPLFEPLLRLARSLRKTQVARQFRAGTSHTTLMISAGEHHCPAPDEPRVSVTLVDPRQSPRMFRLEFDDRMGTLEWQVCHERDAARSLEPFLRLLQQERRGDGSRSESV